MMKTDRLHCGAARRLITPSAELMPDLRALRDDRFGGVLDDIYVRVLAIGDGRNKALIVGFDLDKAPDPEQTLKKISERTGIPEENILYFSTHLHTAPITGVRPEEPPNDIRRKPPDVQAATAEYERRVIDALLEAIEEAVDGMRPAKMGCASGQSCISVNRNQIYEYLDDKGEPRRECGLGANPSAPIDQTLFVLRFDDLEGKPLAFFVNYPVHNCVIIGNDLCDGKIGISGDLSGAICRALEGEHKDSVAIWSSGAAGNINPVMMNEMYYPDPVTGRPQMALLGEGAAVALDILVGRHLADVRKVLGKIECTVDSGQVSAAVSWSLTPGRNVIRRDNGTIESVVGEGVDPYQIRVHLVRIGDVALLGISGELFSSMGLRLKEVSPLEHTVIINHDASLMARSHYIFDDDTLACEAAGILPGVGNSHILPGHVLASLERLVGEMVGPSEDRG